MQKEPVNHIVIKPEMGSKLKYKKQTQEITKKTSISNESLPSSIGHSFNSQDELKEQKVLSFREFI